MLRKIEVLHAITIITLFVLLLCFANIYLKYKNLEKQNKCYQTLYNEDIIGSGCDIYFQNDSWYIEYKRNEVQ